MTVFGRGLIFQLVFASLPYTQISAYNNDTIITLQKIVTDFDTPARTYSHTHTHTNTPTRADSVGVCVYVRARVYVSVCASARMCMSAYVCLCVCVCVETGAYKALACIFTTLRR